MRQSSWVRLLCFHLEGACLHLSSLLTSARLIKSVTVGRRTNVQQLTCNIDLSCSFYYLFFSFVLLELKPFDLKGKVLGKNNEKL